eukprot:3940816-Rhodomonas_salina.1
MPTSSDPTSPDVSSGTEEHIDFEYGIKLGVHKEKYYLLFVLSSSDFMWASSITTCKSPEGLLMSFLLHMLAKIKMLHIEGKLCFVTALEAGDGNQPLR